MPDRLSAPKSAELISRFSADLVNCDTVDGCWSLLTATICQFGFDRMMFGLNSIRSDGQPEPISDALVLFWGEPEYVDRYLDEGHYYSSPLIKWAITHRGAISWHQAASQLDPQPLTPERIRFQQLLADFKLSAGYFLSLADVDSHVMSVLSLGARVGLTQTDADRVWAEHGSSIELAARLFYLRVSTLPRSGQCRPLTSRQKETLRWIGAGKTAREIAQIMDVTPATIEKHLQRARESLKVVSTAQAVQKATRLNLI